MPREWGIVRAARRRFGEPSSLSHDEAHLARFREYTGDMLAPFGLSLGPFEHEGQSYGEMAESLLGELLPDGEQAQLLILVHAVPDIVPGRATATYLSHVCPGKPLAFALCDQGTAGAFTALRLAREYARSGDAQRAVIVIAEQSLLPYDTGASAVPAVHAAVALLTGDRPVALVTGIEVRAERVDTTGRLIASPAAAKRVSTLGDLTRAPEEQPYTGVWWELAGALGGLGNSTVVDFDERLNYLSTLSVGDHSSNSTA
jgi:hypothetical protein